MRHFLYPISGSPANPSPNFSAGSFQSKGRIPKTGSDGNLTVEEVLSEAKKRKIGLLSITDHDSISSQKSAIALAERLNVSYVTGVELCITLQLPNNKTLPLDFLGYSFDVDNVPLRNMLRVLAEHRAHRARRIFQNINLELRKKGVNTLTEKDLQTIRENADGAIGRPHIADYLTKMGIARNTTEAFCQYLVKCDVPKYILSPSEVSTLIRNAGGKAVLAHPNDPHGTSLMKVTSDLNAQVEIIEHYLLEHIDGIECWHSRHDEQTSAFYTNFARKHRLITTGGSDCHQNPTIMGTVRVPPIVARWFI